MGRFLAVVAVVAACGGGSGRSQGDAGNGLSDTGNGGGDGTGTNGGTLLAGGQLTQSTTWTIDMCPIHVGGSIMVGGPGAPDPVILSIPAGCRVLFGTNGQLQVSTNGALQAIGTPSQPITFLNDKFSGGWTGIEMDHISQMVETRLENTIVEQARIGLQVYGDHPTVVSSQFVSCTYDGIELMDGAGFSAASSQIVSISNARYGLVVDIGSSDQIPAANFSGNGAGAALINGTMMTSSTTWTNLNGPYVISGLSIQGSSSPSLTLQAGATVSMLTSMGSIDVGSTSPGTLHALGTSNSPVTFTGATGWGGVWLEAMASGSELTNVVIDNARDALFIYDITVSLKSVSMTTQFSGLNLRGASHLAPDSTALTIHAGFLAVDTNADAAATLPAASSDYGGASSQIWIEAGTVANTGTWHALGPPYMVNGMVSIQSTSTPVVTIEAGAAFEFASQAGITVGDTYPGGLIAQGTALAPILFSSGTATKGSWAGLLFYQSTTSTSLLQNVVVEWGGQGGFVAYPADVYIQGAPGPAIQDSQLWRSAGDGVYVQCGASMTTPPMTNLTFGTGADANVAGDLVKATGCK